MTLCFGTRSRHPATRFSSLWLPYGSGPRSSSIKCYGLTAPVQSLVAQFPFSTIELTAVQPNLRTFCPNIDGVETATSVQDVVAPNLMTFTVYHGDGHDVSLLLGALTAPSLPRLDLEVDDDMKFKCDASAFRPKEGKIQVSKARVPSLSQCHHAPYRSQ